MGCQGNALFRFLSATFILSENFRILVPNSQLKSENLGQNQLKIGQIRLKIV